MNAAEDSRATTRNMNANMHKPRLARLDWLHTDTPIYFLTACTYERRKLLANAGVHGVFVQYAQAAVDHKVWVGRYVLMPDHIHLFAAFTPNSPSVSEWMKGLKAVVSRHLKSCEVEGPYWQERFFDHVLRSEESHAEKWLYVRENPVRAGLVKIWSDWPYQGEIQRLG
jgi:REP element-mobilizing transposase RayT